MNARTFKGFLRSLSVLPNSAASWRMLVIYASKGVVNMLGVRVIYQVLAIRKKNTLL
jgi:hypothetical protein